MKNLANVKDARLKQGKAIVPPSSVVCPHAEECRRSWTPCDDESGAICNYCGQHLSRGTLIEMLTGGAP